MKPEIAYIAAAIIAGITAVALGFLLYKGLSDAGQRYSAYAQACITAGGTWVPMSSQSRRGMCIGGQR